MEVIWQVIKVVKIWARRMRREREDKDYSTHLAKILSVGQGLCNCSVRVTMMRLGPDLMKLGSTK